VNFAPLSRILHKYHWALISIAVAGLWGLNASRIGKIQACPEGCSDLGSRQEGPLRVMSLNVLHGFPGFKRLSTRLDLIADEIRGVDPDIVCLQEVPWAPGLGDGAKYLATLTGYNYVYLPVNGNRWTILFSEGEAILSRYPLKDYLFQELQPRAGFFEHRAALLAVAQTPWGDLHIVSTHLTNGDPDTNRDQAASLASFVTEHVDGIGIVAGDFNAEEDSPQIVDLSHTWLDIYRIIHPSDDGFTCCIDDLTNTPKETLEERIDYIFLVPAFDRSPKVLDSQRVLDHAFATDDDWQWASDHVGLAAIIDINP
jgi:endonuclease/exonuclease/phosphatase family metal-dependent hydrolase